MDWWRATQYGQDQLLQSFIDVLKNNQRAGDCNRLIYTMENIVKTMKGNLFSSVKLNLKTVCVILFD